jgi:hypothetical protein
MALKKVTLVKPWVHPVGLEFKEGESFRVLPELYEELAEGGYISVPKAAPKAAPKKATNKKK